MKYRKQMAYGGKKYNQTSEVSYKDNNRNK